MDASRRYSSMLATWLAVAVAGTLGVAAMADAATDATMGTWQEHKLTFSYLGDVTGSHYSCEGLIEDLTFLLRQSGAHVNAPVQVTPCIHGAGAPSVLLAAKLDFSTFVPADEQSGQSPSVPGTWRRVVFSEPHSFPTLHFADCELVLEFKDKLLQYFTTRNVESNLHCIPYQEESGLYGLGFQTFVPTDTPHRAVGGGGGG